METTILMETGQLHGDVALQPIIEDVLKNAASAMGRPHATTCEELADLCSMPDARLLRVVCGATCGCTELRTSAWHKVESMGCAKPCLEDAEAKLQGASCEDDVINDAGWQAFWHQYEDALIGLYGPGVTQTQLFGSLNTTAQSFLTDGCPVMSTLPFELLTGVSWCDGQPNLFRPLASMCPVQCGCRDGRPATLPNGLPSYCPTSCSNSTQSDRRQSALNMVLYEQLREDCGVTMIFCVHPDRTFASAARSTHGP
eukprot:s80_g6.t1